MVSKCGERVSIRGAQREPETAGGKNRSETSDFHGEQIHRGAADQCINHITRARRTTRDHRRRHVAVKRRLFTRILNRGRFFCAEMDNICNQTGTDQVNYVFAGGLADSRSPLMILVSFFTDNRRSCLSFQGAPPCIASLQLLISNGLRSLSVFWLWALVCLLSPILTANRVRKKWTGISQSLWLRLPASTV